MKKIFYVITGHLFFNTIFALGVYDLFKLSEKNHPSFYKINLSKYYAAQKTKELKGLALPTVSFDATADYGNKSLLGKSGLSRIDHTESIGLEATLYQGGAEYNYFDYKKLLPKIAKSEIHLHRLNYYMQINHHYYRFLSYRNEKLKLERQLLSVKNRVKTLEQRSRIGRSRKTDYLSSLSQQKRIEAVIEEVREYLELEGIKLKELVAAEFDLDKLNYKFDEDWDVTNDNDLSHRPDLKLMDLRIQDEKLTLKEVNSSWKPEVTLDSNYYVGKRELQFTQDDWDVSLSFSWEIFDFGTRKASQKLQEIEIKRLEYSKKELEIQLGATWKSLKNQFKNRIKRLDKLKIANDLAIENFKEHQREFKKGLINSIELTRSQDELIESELLYEKLKYQIAEQASAMNAFMGKTKL